MASATIKRPISVGMNGDTLFIVENNTHVRRKKLVNGINIFDIDTDNYTLDDLLHGQEFLSDTVFDDREYLANLLPEENKIYFIRITGHGPNKVKCMVKYNPNWNCQMCTYQNSHKDKCEICDTPKPRFRSYLKSGKTKRSKSRSKRSKSIH
jgi:hypothetical protein